MLFELLSRLSGSRLLQKLKILKPKLQFHLLKYKKVTASIISTYFIASKSYPSIHRTGSHPFYRRTKKKNSHLYKFEMQLSPFHSSATQKCSNC